MQTLKWRSPDADGFTLIECLVVIAIIGLMAAITTTVVQSSRETARQAQCQNNLRQLGTALNTHVSKNSSYPSGFVPDTQANGNTYLAAGPLSVHYQLLPSLEQSTIFNNMNVIPHLRTSTALETEFNYPAMRPANRTAVNSRVGVFLCPSDSIMDANFKAGCSYRACIGAEVYPFDMSGHVTGGGAFPGFIGILPAQVSDGLSHTIAMSERLCGSKTFTSRFRDVWFSGINSVTPYPATSRVFELCTTLDGNGFDWFAESGFSWAPASLNTTLYNNVQVPNPLTADCSADNGSDLGTHDSSGGLVTARSNHSGIVNTLLMDGSVRATKNTVRRAVWRSLATRGGGEIITAEEL